MRNQPLLSSIGLSLLFVLGITIVMNANCQVTNNTTKKSYPEAALCKVVPDDRGIYLSAYMGTVGDDAGPGKADMHRRQINYFHEVTGRHLALSYVLSPLLAGKFEFPTKQVEAVWDCGAIPLISLLPISNWTSMGLNVRDPVFSMQKFADGSFDEGLKNWALKAKASGIPLMIAFGQEVRGGGWPWSGGVNGGGTTTEYGDPKYPDGPERFRDAYRHIVELFTQVRARNVTWVYWTSLPCDPDHFKYLDIKKTWWDHDRYYYPGDKYIDWIAAGATGYFPQGGWTDWHPMQHHMDVLYRQLVEVAPSKPQLIELSVAYNPKKGDMSHWITDAYSKLASRRWPNVKAVNWWYQHYPEDSKSAFDVTPQTLACFREAIARPIFIDKAVVRSAAKPLSSLK